MIKGFIKQTEELNNKELLLVPLFVKGFSHRYGIDQAITNAEIRKRFKEQKNIKISDARVRKIINYIRLEGLMEDCLKATSKGYYLTKDKKEIQDYVDSLNQRIEAIEGIRDAMAKFII